MLKTFRPNVGRSSKSFRGGFREVGFTLESSRRERQGFDDSAGQAGEQGHPEASLDKSCRRQGGRVEDWVQAGEDPELRKENKTDSGSKQKKKKGLLPQVVLTKSPQFSVTQGQEVKPRIIIMKTICLHHFMLPEIPWSESKVENPRGSAACWK